MRNPVYATLAKLACALIVATLVNFLLWRPHAKSALKPIRAYVELQQRTDSWLPMSRALDYLAQKTPSDAPLYKHLFFEEKTKFQYPPTSLVLPYLLGRAGLDAMAVERWINFLLIPATALVLSLIFRAARGSTEWLGTTMLMLLLTFSYFPIIRACNLGQIQVWINTMFAGLFLCVLRGWWRPAGVLVGLMCLIKPPYLLLLIWGAVRRRWGFTAAGVVTMVAGTLVSLSLFGWANHWDYLSVPPYLSRHGEAYFANQSMNGLLNRLYPASDILKWYGWRFPDFHPAVYAGTLCFALGMAALAFLLPRHTPHAGGLLDL